MLISLFAQKGGFGLLIIQENQTDLGWFKRLKKYSYLFDKTWKNTKIFVIIKYIVPIRRQV